jgi:hypothetical protein
MLVTDNQRTVVNLQFGQSWPSFEKFRAKGATPLSSVKNGTFATLHTTMVNLQ